MKKKIAIILTVILILSLVACGKIVESNEVYAFPEPPTEINITNYGCGRAATYSLEEFNSIMNWFYKLKIAETNHEPEPVEGNQLFEIIVDGKEAFSYDNRGNKAYLYVNDKIYKVKNPTNPPYDEKRHIFNATVIEISNNYFLVEPIESIWELNSSDRFQVPMEHMDASPEPEIGDTLEIIYNGEFQETYPAVITDVYSVKVVKEMEPETPNALVPSIMYNGEIYRTTGKQIPAEVDESAYVGKITSTVPLSEMPTEEGQANFGEIGTPYAVTSDGVVVLMNNEWTVFEIME